MLLEKLNVLGDAGSWDSCGGVKQKSFRESGIPAEYGRFVYDCSASSESCRLMKVLQSNKCIHDCKYCVNPTGKQKKLSLEPEEIAKSFTALKRKGHVEGLFLSSAVTKNAETTTEKMIESARLVRERFGFKGYIHLKVLPDTPKHLIQEMGKLASRLSLNIETPRNSYLNELSSTKDYFKDLQKRIFWINEVKRKERPSLSFTTQFILGAAEETDREVLKKMDFFYERTELWRSYFSAFRPVNGSQLEERSAENSKREHKLYEADWLLRFYGFKRKEVDLGLNEEGNFSFNTDVKTAIALNNENLFPLDPNDATKEELLRVPGIGPKTVERILAVRDSKKFRELKELESVGAITKRAQGFLQLEKMKQTKLGAFVN